jgi:hypothetical protein
MLTLATLTVRATECVDPIPFHNANAEVPATIKGCVGIVGGLSSPGKMPCHSYSLDARKCKTGGKLRKVEGSTCSKCYAYGGCYNFPVVLAAMARRFASLTDPRWTAAFIRILNRKRNKFFRWHDSGDLQSLNHLRNIVEVAKHTPTVTHWIPTREYGLVRQYLRTYGDFPANLRVRVSAAMMESDAPGFSHTSEVSKRAAERAAERTDAFACIAYTQNGECRDCRACWSPVRTVIYPLH